MPAEPLRQVLADIDGKRARVLTRLLAQSEKAAA
jgi:hypothetical protein